MIFVGRADRPSFLSSSEEMMPALEKYVRNFNEWMIYHGQWVALALIIMFASVAGSIPLLR